jgi:hypothetical protein
MMADVPEGMLPGACFPVRVDYYDGPDHEAPAIIDLHIVPTPQAKTQDAILVGFHDLAPTLGGSLSEWPILVFRAPPPQRGETLTRFAWRDWMLVEVNG